MDPTGGSTLIAVASLNSWTLDMSTDKVDVTAFGDTNKQYVQGLPDYKGTIGGFLDTSDLTIFDVALGTVAPKLRLMPSTLDSGIYFEGLAYLDASLSVSATGAVTVSGSWVAAGPWTMTP